MFFYNDLTNLPRQFASLPIAHVRDYLFSDDFEKKIFYLGTFYEEFQNGEIVLYAREPGEKFRGFNEEDDIWYCVNKTGHKKITWPKNVFETIENRNNDYFCFPFTYVSGTWYFSAFYFLGILEE